MRLADSSFLIALFQSGDQNYGAAEKAASDPQPILVVSEVLSETLGILQKRKGVDFARMVKHWIDSQPHFQFGFTQRTHFDHASKIFTKSRERLNYVDAVVVAWKVALRAELLTYDEKLRLAAEREAA